MNKIESWEEKGNRHVSLDETEKAKPHHLKIAQLAVKYCNGPDYLDIGCGLGHIPAHVQTLRPDVKISIADAYPICLKKTSRRLNENVQSKYILSEADFDILEKIPEKFDVITMSHVLEHLHSPVQGIKDVMALLKPGGSLILAVPNPARPHILILNIFQRHYVNRGHVYAWDMSHFKNFLEEICGLKVVEYTSDTITPLPVFLGVPLARIIPWWGFSNIAVIKN